MRSQRERIDAEERIRRNGHETTTFTARDLKEMKLPPVKWAIPDLLPEGVTILAGRSKIGKSFLVFGLCIAVATGGDALGRLPVGRGDVHYIALEDNKRRLQQRLIAMMGDRDAPANLTISVAWPRLDEGGTEKLREWLTEHPDARLVVIDILKSVRPRNAGGRNIYDVDYEALAPLKPLIEDFGVSIVVVHHLNQGHSDDPLQLISGSEGLVGVVDGTLVMRRERGKHDATLHVAGKDIVDEREHALRWDAETTSWTLIGDADDFRISDQRRAIREALRQLARPATIGEIAAHLDEPYDNVRKLVGKSERDNLIYLHHMDGASKYFSLHPPDPNDPNTQKAEGDRTGRDGNDPSTNPRNNAESGPDRTVRSVRSAEGEADPILSDPVSEWLAASPPPWVGQRARATARAEHGVSLDSLASAVACEVFGSAHRWRECLAPLREKYVDVVDGEGRE